MKTYITQYNPRSIFTLQVLAFNYKIQIGLRRGITEKDPWSITKYQKDSNPPFEEVPQWADAVPRLPELLIIVPGAEVLQGPPTESMSKTPRGFGPFAKRNIYAHFEQLYVVHSIF